MDFNLQRRLRLKTAGQIEHKSLYNWAIVEIDDHGAQVGDDMIPWGWTLDFEATELVVTDRLRFESQDLRGRDLEKQSMAQASTIQAKLRPRNMREDKVWPASRRTGSSEPIASFQNS